MAAEMKINNPLDQLIADSIKELNISNGSIHERMGMGRNLYIRLRENPEHMLVEDIINLSKAIHKTPEDIFETCLAIARENLKKGESKGKRKANRGRRHLK